MKSRKRTYFKYFSLFFILIAFILITGCNGTPPSVPIINSFSADFLSITAGEISTLSWSVTDATTVIIDQGVGTVALSGATTVSPIITITYTLTATNTAGSVTASVTVTVGAAYGSIDINSTPDGAKVYLDGEDTGQVTPIVLNNVAVGDHIIELRKFHYQSWEDVVTVIAGQTAYLNPPLVWAPEESVTLQPDAIEGKDTCVWYNHPTSNYGNDDYLWVGTLTGVIVRSYLQFNLSPVPPEAVILDASLGLYYYYSYGLTSISIGLYEVTESWAEDTITWDNQPASSSEAVDIQILPTIQTDDFVHWQIGDLVKGWLEGSIANYGMLLRHTDESSVDDVKWFFSSDYSTAIDHPKLIINFYVP